MKNKQQLSYPEYEKKIGELQKNEKIKVSSIGKSIMGRNLQKLEIGSGEKKILLLGGVYGESEVCETLLSFAEEFVKSWEAGRRMCGTNPAYVSIYRSLVIYPLLNPDALEYRREGITDDNPIRSRLISMNSDSDDFSDWISNGRGISLERNSPIGFEKRKSYENARGIFNGDRANFSGNTPESEPELCALFEDVLKYESIKAFVQISEGRKGVYAADLRSGVNGSGRTLKSIMRVCGMRSVSGTEDDNGITDHICQRYGICAYKISTEKCDLKHLRDILYALPVII